MNMMAQEDVKVEGSTSFAAPSPSYRYTITLKNGKMSIWMEDRVSRKQWFKGDMTKDDFVTSDNMITGASLGNYVQCFQDLLDCDLSELGDEERKTTHLSDDDVLHLELTARVCVLRSSWKATYSFRLDLFTVERIDILESNLRDQQEEVERLSSELERAKTPIAIELDAFENVAGMSILSWHSIKSSTFVVDGENGVIKINRPGMYVIGVDIHLFSDDSDDDDEEEECIELQKNGRCLDTGNSNTTVASLNALTRLDAGDEIKVVCPFYMNAHAHLTAVRLGSFA
ncbi:hypothetical protein KRP22_014014 [Phytophthora ramorum]|nr:hypothetical protein KRP22_13842 [Phytophthora ramorum]